jgi:hypothetical protein
MSTNLSTLVVDGAQSVHRRPRSLNRLPHSAVVSRHQRPVQPYTRCPPSIHGDWRFSTQLSTGCEGNGAIVGRVTRSPTYAHKGLVVHILRPVIHDHSGISAALPNPRFLQVSRKIAVLPAVTELSTLIVDNYETCG